MTLSLLGINIYLCSLIIIRVTIVIEIRYHFYGNFGIYCFFVDLFASYILLFRNTLSRD